MNNPIYNQICLLFDDINSSTIDYVLMRRAEHISKLTSKSGDIDILIDWQQLDSLRKLINKFVSKNKSFVYYTEFEFKTVKIFITFQDTNNIPHSYVLDIHSCLSYRSICFLNTKDYLAEKIFETPFWRPPVTIELYSLLIRAIVMKGYFNENDENDIPRLLETCHTEFTQYIENMLGTKLSNKLLRLLQNNDFHALLSLKQGIIHKTTGVKFYIQPMYYLYTVYDMFTKLIKRRGALIVFLGPDGSGKTTLITEINSILSDAGLKVATSYYGTRTPLLPTKWMFKRLRHGKSMHSDANDLDSMKNLNHKKEFVFLIGSLHNLADLVLRYIIRERIKLNRARLVLADRYFYDLLLDPTPAFLRTLHKNLVLLVAPKPDLTILLMDDANTIYKRKPELSLNEIKRQQNVFMSLENKIENTVILKQTDDIRNNAISIVGDIINAYSLRNSQCKKTR